MSAAFRELLATAASAAPAKIAPIDANVAHPDGFTFDALFLRHAPPPKEKKDNSPQFAFILLPLNLARLVDAGPPDELTVFAGSGDAQQTLYEPATQDGRAVWLDLCETQVEEHELPKDTLTGKPDYAFAAPGVTKPNKLKKVKVLCTLPQRELIAEGVPLRVSMFEAGQTPPPQPMELVKVYNLVAKKPLDGRRPLFSIMSGGADARMHPAANAAPPYLRLAWATPYEAQLLPRVLTLNHADARDQWSRFPHTVTRLVVNRAREGDAAPFVLQPPGLALGVQPRAGAIVTIHEMSRKFYVAADPAKQRATDMTCFHYKLRVAQTRADGTRAERYFVKELTLFAEHVKTLGIRYPRWVNALLSAHPIPFQVLLGVDVDASLREDANQPAAAEKRQGFDDGMVVPNGWDKEVQYLVMPYLRQCGVPCTFAGTVHARYGSADTVTPYEPDDFEEVTKDRQVKGTFVAKMDNPLLAKKNNTHGVLPLDEYKGKMPSADAYAAYALLLVPLREPLPSALVEGTPYPAELAPRRVTLTPEQGDALLASYRRPVAAGASAEEVREAWLQPAASRDDVEKRTPIALFFAVSKAAMQAADEYDAECARKAAGVAAAALPDMPDDLPPTLDGLCAQWPRAEDAGAETRGKRSAEDAELGAAADGEVTSAPKEARTDEVEEKQDVAVPVQ